MLLTKVRMGMNHRDPPQCLILFEYDTNTERHALTVQEFLFVHERCKRGYKNLLTLEKVTYFSNLQIRWRYYTIVN
jgi:hypothetical protein